MRKRNIHIQFWLNEKEAAAFTKRVKKSGLSREAYLRQLIKGLIPKALPPPDYYLMMKELHAIGNNLNQIAQRANAIGLINKEDYEKNVEYFKKAVKVITDAVIAPERADKWP